MKCLKGLLLIGLTSTFFAGDGYVVDNDVFPSTPERKGTLVVSAEIQEEMQSAKNMLVKISSELDSEVWNSIEQAFVRNNLKSIVALLDEIAAWEKVARPGIGKQREYSLRQGILSISGVLARRHYPPRLQWLLYYAAIV